MDVITCHVNADFDCLSAMVGAKKLFPGAVMVFPGSQEKPLREFLKTFPVEVLRMRDLDLDGISRLIIVDTNSPERIGMFKSILGSKGLKTFLYDHHLPSDNSIQATLATIEEVGAAATIMTEILRDKKIPIAPMEATMLALGIYEETGSMRFPSTTERDLLAAAYLLRRGANLNIVASYIKPQMSREDLALLNELMNTLEEILIGGVRLKIGSATIDAYMGDAAQLAHSIMDMEDIDGLVLVLNMDDKTVLIARSRAAEFDASQLMKRFDGGGHPMAASAIVKQANPAMVREDVSRILHEIVRPTKTVRDVMTGPVVSIQWNSTIKEAQQLLTKYEINVLPVLIKSGYQGLITREIVEKAIFHGFHQSIVMEFTTSDAMITTPDTSIREIEEAMIENNQRFVPVLEEEKVVGAITRTDLLRTIYEDYIRRRRTSQPTHQDVKPHITRNVSTLLKERFPRHFYGLLVKAGDVADFLGVKVYLVGGTVRDLLRAEQNFDMDIVVEGDGPLYAQELASRLHCGKLVTHSRFQTAKLSCFSDMPRGLPSDFSIDIATARTEYYEKPAALPTVETSSIKRDLYRRDFTINTLAVCLNHKGFGNLIDFFGGQRDLKERTIRVLHNLSFIEDPTRAFRAVRFSERFDFKISKHTEKLMKTALRFNLFDRLSGSRLYDELLLTFRETEPVKATKRLSTYSLLKVIHQDLDFTRQMEVLLQSVHDAISWYRLAFFEREIDTGTIYMMALLYGLSVGSLGSALERLSAPPKVCGIVSRALQNAHPLLSVLVLDDPVGNYRVLSGLPIENILFLMAMGNDEKKKKAISKYLTEQRYVKPLVDGKVLIRMGIVPGPVYSAIMKDVLEQKLLGRLASLEEEITYVKENYISLCVGDQIPVQEATN
ncbi:MAG: CBS domain-containing protein [Nitrospirae bacterium]|nr:CBS domain-containing protein [Nitrospirota bacterium]